MDTEYWWFYDLFILVTILFCAYSGYKKGFAKVIVMMIGYIAVVILSIFIGNIAGPVVYEKYVKQVMVDSVKDIVDEYNFEKEFQKVMKEVVPDVDFKETEIDEFIMDSSKNMSENLYQLYLRKNSLTFYSEKEFNEKINENLNNIIANSFNTGMPAFVEKEIKKATQKNNNLLLDTFKVITGDSTKAAEYIEEKYVRSITVKLLKAFIYLISFLVLSLLLQFVEKIIRESHSIPVLGSADSLFGAILGIIQALAITILISLVIKFVISLSINEIPIFNSNTINQTKIFKHIYDLNEIIMK